MARAGRASALLLLLGAAACAQAPAPVQGPIAGAQQVTAAAVAPAPAPGLVPAVAQGPPGPRPLVLRRTRLRRLGPELERLAGKAFRARATDPVAIDVQLTEPLDGRALDSAPLIELNGVALPGTYRDPAALDRLVAFLPERALLRPQNEVRVLWSSSALATRSPRAHSISDQPEEEDRGD